MLRVIVVGVGLRIGMEIVSLSRVSCCLGEVLVILWVSLMGLMSVILSVRMSLVSSGFGMMREFLSKLRIESVVVVWVSVVDCVFVWSL